MKAKEILAATLVGVWVVTGCVSVDSTRTQLASSNPKEVQKAEQNVYTIAVSGHDATGFVGFSVGQRVEYVNLVTNNELLLKIIENTYESRVIGAAASRIDFTKPGIGMEILTKYERALSRIAESSEGGDESRQEPFIEKVLATLNENELRRVLEIEKVDDGIKNRAARRLVETTTDVDFLLSVCKDEMRYSRLISQRSAVVRIIDDMLNKISDSAVIIDLVKKSRDIYSGDELEAVLLKLLSRLPEDDAVKYALERVENYQVYDWNEGRVLHIAEAIVVATIAKESATVFFNTGKLSYFRVSGRRR